LKDIYTPNAIYPLILLKAKINKSQKISIPFKNLSIKAMQIEFYFESSKKEANNLIISKNKNTVYNCILTCFPSSIHIEPQASLYLEIICKVLPKKERLDSNIVTNLKDKIRKVLIGKLSKSNIFFMFFIEIELIQ